MRYFIHKFLVPLTLVVVFTTFQYCQAGGTNSFNFLKMNIGSRSQGMGNAFTAVSSDLNSVYYNPAGIGFSSRPGLMFFHGQLYEDLAIENFTAIYPNLRNITLSVGVSYLHLPAIEKYDIDLTTGEPIPGGGEFNVYDFVPQLGIAYRLTNSFALGLQFKYLMERLDDVTASGVAFDLGALYKLPVDYLSLGASVQNLGPKIKYDIKRENLPITYRLGVAYQLPEYFVTFTFDGVKTVNEDWQFLPGFEVEFLQSLAIRAGYQFNQDLGAGYNLGAGFNFLDNYRINYVFSPYGILGSTHKAEINLNFGRDYGQGRAVRDTRYAEKYTATELNLNRNISYLLPVPDGLNVKQGVGELTLNWNPVEISEARYNIYVQIKGRTDLVKINKTPVSDTSFVFKPTVSNLKLRFYVCMVKNDKESEFSKPLDIEYNSR